LKQSKILEQAAAIKNELKQSKILAQAAVIRTCFIVEHDFRLYNLGEEP
jgi:hypothetical protein